MSERTFVAVVDASTFTDAGADTGADAGAGADADAGADAGADADAGTDAGAVADLGADAGADADAGTVRWSELLAEAVARFECAGIETAPLDARRVVEEITGVPVSGLHRVLDNRVTTRAMARFDELVARREQGEPLQYVLGRWGFRTLDLIVDQRVLIPRPETETVAGLAIDAVNELRQQQSPKSRAAGRAPERPVAPSPTQSPKSRVAGRGAERPVAPSPVQSPKSRAAGRGAERPVAPSPTQSPKSRAAGRAPERPVVVADLGTGSGAIALSVAVECRGCRVYATDVSEQALSVARANLAGIGAAATAVSLHHGHWFGALPDHLQGSLDVVVSNPPYVAPSEGLPAVITDWEPATALRAGSQGLADLRTIVDQAPQWLAPHGVIVLEMSPPQTPTVQQWCIDLGWQATIHSDLNDRPRAVVARR